MKPIKKEELFGERVTLGKDGKYRWRYELNLFTTPVILWLILKIFLCIFLGIFTVVSIADARRGMDTFLTNLRILGIVLIVMIALVLVSYLIYAAIMGGKYIVEFEMDEKGVLHRQTAAQAKKAKKLADVTMIAGVASGKPGTVAAGIAASNTERYSEFAKVRRIIFRPAFHLIKVNHPFNHNQVYVCPEDYDLVKDYLLSHCQNTKGKK
ncbi:MAG: hypothetical protein IJR88_05940 [Clostridia bacterium]|nr:hypothetical protein [Clostridia bacterium]